MTAHADVIDLTARRRARAPKCLCRDGWQCYPHRLTDLAARVGPELATAQTSLLIPSIHVSELLGEVLAVLTGITDETLPHERQEAIR